MTIGLAIIAHAIRMLIHEPGTTIRVILPGLLMVLGSTIASYFLIPETLAAMISSNPDDLLQVPPAHILVMFALGIAALVGYALMAIFWHRHVLLNGPDRSDLIRPSSSVIANYIWRAIIVAFVQMLAAIPILLGMAMLAALIGGMARGGPALLTSLLAGIAFVWVALRISIILPAAAMGNRMRILESWTLSAPLTGAIFAISALLSLLNITVSVLAGLILPDPGSLGLLVETCIFLIEGLVFVSVLTTLYGHLVEGRPLG